MSNPTGPIKTTGFTDLDCREWRGFTLCTKPVERKILITNFGSPRGKQT